jgi:UDP-N-acetylmuramyl pentapeptide phosphotransferase/UDP-N-acetylglucosamine-1-phosphate transferase
MEKYTDTSSQDADSENATLIASQSLRDETTKRRQNFLYLTLFNLFLFVVSMLSMVCAVMSQRNPSGNSAAKLMDQFEIFCMPNHHHHVLKRLVRP